jgi:transcription initiation factor TFIIIB Brf1 subunit/transcription initiation factor TFIIB
VKIDLHRARAMIMSNDGRSMEYYTRMISEICNLLTLDTRVLDTARNMAHRYTSSLVHHENQRFVLKPRGPEAAVAFISLACSQVNAGRTLTDLLNDLELTEYEDTPGEHEVVKACRKILKQLPDVERQTGPENVIVTFCQTLELDARVSALAMKYQEQIQPYAEGKTVNTVAGGCILMGKGSFQDVAPVVFDVPCYETI